MEDFLVRINKPYFNGLLILSILGLFFFLRNPSGNKKNSRFYIAFSFLILVVFYEFASVYLLVDKKLNQFFHELITDVPFKGYNVWVFNIFNYLISKILLVIWINLFITNPKLKKSISFLLVGFIISSLIIIFSRYEEISYFFTVIPFLGYVLSIIASGLFFVDLITSDSYLSINPMRFIPFWLITFNLFQNAILLLADLAADYLAFNNTKLYYLFNYISQTLYILMLISIVVIFMNKGLFIEKKVKTA